MTQNKRTVPVLAHRNGLKMREDKENTRSPMVHILEGIVHQILIRCGAAGVGLFVGVTLPSLLHLTPWQPWPVTTAIALCIIGLREETR